MSIDIKIAVSACILALFGAFLIWQGATGNVVKTNQGKVFIPRWVYFMGGIGMLLLPLFYLYLMLFVVE